MAYASAPVLVVGKVTTEADVADLTAFASDVADRLRMPAVVAVGRDYRLEEWEAVVLADGWETTPESAALGCEAMLADMCTMWANDVYEHPINTMCGHCGTVDPDAAPVYLNGMWTTSVCPGCVSEHTRATSEGFLVAA